MVFKMDLHKDLVLTGEVCFLFLLLLLLLLFIRLGTFLYSASMWCYKVSYLLVNKLRIYIQRQIKYYSGGPQVRAKQRLKSAIVSYKNTVWIVLAHPCFIGLIAAGVFSGEGSVGILLLRAISNHHAPLVVLAIRTWAAWHQSLRIGIVLAVLQVCYIVSWCIFTEHLMQSSASTFFQCPISAFHQPFPSIGSTVSWLQRLLCDQTSNRKFLDIYFCTERRHRSRCAF